MATSPREHTEVASRALAALADPRQRLAADIGGLLAADAGLRDEQVSARREAAIRQIEEHWHWLSVRAQT